MGLAGPAFCCCGPCQDDCACLVFDVAGIADAACHHCDALNGSYRAVQQQQWAKSCQWSTPPVGPDNGGGDPHLRTNCCDLAINALLVRERGRWILRATVSNSSMRYSTWEADFGFIKPAMCSVSGVGLTLIDAGGAGACDHSGASLTVSGAGEGDCTNEIDRFDCWCGDDIPDAFSLEVPGVGTYVLNHDSGCEWRYESGPPDNIVATLSLGFYRGPSGHLVYSSYAITASVFGTGLCYHALTYGGAVLFTCEDQPRCDELVGIELPRTFSYQPCTPSPAIVSAM